MSRFYLAFKLELEQAVHVSKDTAGMTMTQAAWHIADRLQTGEAAKLACKQGCASCCSQPVKAFRDEARLAASLAVQVLSPQVLDLVIRALKDIKRIMAMAAKADDFEAAYSVYQRVCPFLSLQQRCLIYDARPRFCRTRHSTDVESCKTRKTALMDGKTPPDLSESPILSMAAGDLNQAYEDVYRAEVKQRHDGSPDWGDEYFAPQVLRELNRQRILVKK